MKRRDVFMAIAGLVVGGAVAGQVKPKAGPKEPHEGPGGQSLDAADSPVGYITRQSGDFDDPDTWSPRGVPGSHDTAILHPDHRLCFPRPPPETLTFILMAHVTDNRGTRIGEIGRYHLAICPGDDIHGIWPPPSLEGALTNLRDRQRARPRSVRQGVTRTAE
jgi:hypothetical protein